MSQAALVLVPNAGPLEEIGKQLRAALPATRVHALSLHDGNAGVLWLSSGALGPDEHSAVLAAMRKCNLDPKCPGIGRPLGSGRTALVLPARSAAGEVCGAAMILMEGKIGTPALRQCLASDAVRTTLAELAAHLQARSAAEPAESVESVAESVAPNPAASVAATPSAEIDSAALDEEPSVPDGEATMIAPAPETRDLVLVVQQLLKLRSGGRTQRFEVLVRSRSDPTREAAPTTLIQALTARNATSAIDRFVLTELVKWLGAHNEVWEVTPSSFTVNLSNSTIRDGVFLRFAAALFEEHKVSPSVVGFEIPERAFIETESSVRSFVDGCEKIGCFIAIDDFTMHSSAVPYLASPALRIVKIDPKLTAGAMKDKLSQALIIAISQAAKVLGVHGVAKRIESTMARQWLAAIGIDFAQGFALERPQTLDSLLASLKPAATRKH
jgi:EAL domain-containing protein (putative c-di-GMP-specific phosphodiesterase class I)